MRIQVVANAAMADAILMPAERSEGDLLAQAKRGDLDAFERLMRLHERKVYLLSLRLTGDPEDAKDAAQETFIRLHKKLGQIDSERSVGPWLCTVAANVCRDFGRERRRAKTAAMNEHTIAMPDPAAGPERLAAGQQQHARLREALLRLPERERTALVLREIEGLSTHEAAKILGSTEATVRSQISNARLKLREWFADRGGRR
jgi:RNA polymerase sigma factor (sigma-70 family)